MSDTTTRQILIASSAALLSAILPACGSDPNQQGQGGSNEGGTSNSGGSAGHHQASTGGSAAGGSSAGGSSAGGGGAGAGGGAPKTRDPHQQPFATTSIWNMPIGSDAKYVDANLPAVPGNAGGSIWEPWSDTDYIVLQPDAPLVQVKKSDVGWGAGSRCDPDSDEGWPMVPMPDDYVVPSGPFNNAAAILAQDGRTFIQFEPLARCNAGGGATSLVQAQSSDLYGDGIKGAHGGSGMSAIGGTLRIGELRPGDKGVHHALKFTMNMYEFYKCGSPADCFRWPAQTADSYAVGHYGYGDNNPNVDNQAMKMGALLALPADLDLDSLDLKSEPGKEVAWTLQNYGAYVDEDSFGASFLMGTEFSPKGAFAAQFKADYGFDFNQNSDSGNAWSNDFQKIMVKLKVVDNNDADHIGGGGTPRQPLAPPISPP